MWRGNLGTTNNTVRRAWRVKVQRQWDLLITTPWSQNTHKLTFSSSWWANIAVFFALGIFLHLLQNILEQKEAVLLKTDLTNSNTFDWFTHSLHKLFKTSDWLTLTWTSSLSRVIRWKGRMRKEVNERPFTFGWFSKMDICSRKRAFSCLKNTYRHLCIVF